MADVPFLVDFSAPSPAANLTAVGHSYTGDFTGQPSGVDLAWLPVNTSPENIKSIDLWMIDSREAVKIASFTDPDIVAYTYPFPRAGETITYRIYQTINVGGQTQIGLWGSATFGSPMHYISLVSTVSPTTLRAVFRGMSAASETLMGEDTFQSPAGGKNYKRLRGSIRGRGVSVTVDLDDEVRNADAVSLTAKELKLMVENMFDEGDTLCLRDSDGGKWFGHFDGNPTFSRKSMRPAWTLPITFRKVSYTEGPTS